MAKHKYKVRIIEVEKPELTIQASSKDEAMKLIKDLFPDDEIIDCSRSPNAYLGEKCVVAFIREY